MVINEVGDTLTAFAGGPRPAVVLPPSVTDEAISNASTRSRLAELLEVSDTAISTIVDGSHTIGPVACLNPYRSPHDEEGRFCRQAGSQLCLTCSNAVITGEHVPPLWDEVERLDRVAATMAGDAFRALHGETYQTLLHILEVFDPEAVARYRQRGIVPPHPSALTPARLVRRRARGWIFPSRGCCGSGRGTNKPPSGSGPPGRRTSWSSRAAGRWDDSATTNGSSRPTGRAGGPPRSHSRPTGCFPTGTGKPWGGT